MVKPDPVTRGVDVAAELSQHAGGLPLLPEGTLVADRYRVIRWIGFGGMGGVCEVLDHVTDRRRAMKIVRPDVSVDADLLFRLQREAKICGRVESQHVVEVLDAGLVEELKVPFVIMELLRGQDFGGLVKSKGCLEPGDAIVLLKQVALGLTKTHQEAIIHRDIKLENLFVTETDEGTPLVKILDFGIAKVIASASSSLGATRSLGTPLYMAPEQLRGDGTIDERADLYSLAHVTYALVVGHPYWEAERKSAPNVYAFLLTISEGTRETATQRAAKFDVRLPPAFDDWFFKATAVDPADRYPTAWAQHDDLERVFRGEIPIARPRQARQPKRNRLRALGAGIFLVLSGIVLHAFSQHTIVGQRARQDVASAQRLAVAAPLVEPAASSPNLMEPKPRARPLDAGQPTAAPPVVSSRRDAPLDEWTPRAKPTSTRTDPLDNI